MSKGPGRWQQVILSALADDHDVGEVRTIVYNDLRRDPTRSEMVAARRAVKTLALAGKVRAIYLGKCPCGELSENWRGHCSGWREHRAVLAVTTTTGVGAGFESLRVERAPNWISVAPSSDDARATLIAEVRKLLDKP